MSAIAEMPPAIWLLAASFLLCFTRDRVSSAITILVPLGALALLLQMDPGSSVSFSFAGLELRPFELGPVNRVFGIIFLLISAIAGIYAWHLNARWQQVMATAYAAGALGVTFAGDFFTLLVFWEVMAVASAWLVFARRKPDSIRAGFRYLMVHFTGGSILLGGILWHFHESGSLLLTPLSPG
ncbi:MAG TPA: proton-conducting transporter membrane subunit, partial [Oceanipulchritudo sp.]|nr:proton-conducting transporter membrane subunit [Oceanipulchritudo sp.]